MTRKVLLFFILLTFFFRLPLEAQVVQMKSGSLDLSQLEANAFSLSNTKALFESQFYGLAYANVPAQIKSEHVISWFSPQVALVTLALEETAREVKYYRLPREYKMDPLLRDSLPNAPKELSLIINLYQFNTSIQSTLETYGSLGVYNGLSQSVNIQLLKDSLAGLLDLPFVFWAEFPAPALETHNLRERTNHRVPSIQTPGGPFNLTGKGVIMGEWDGGGADNHIDYDYRMTRIDNFFNNGNGRHATHVAGTMLGAGIKDPNAKGMAPEATFYSYDFFGSVTSEMDSAARKYGIEFTQNSYGYSSSWDDCTRRGTYDNTSVGLDRLVNKYPNLLHVFSAGNSRGSNCLGGGYGTVGSGYQSSKNSLAVGAVRFTDANSWFSSYGPVRDGRLKPEITAVGVDVYSTFPDNTYRGGYNGTSMSCPGTSGTAALITQLYKEKFDTLPDAHLIKGVLCNGADDLGRLGPDYQYGFGRLNGFVAANVINDTLFTLDTVSQGTTFKDTIFVGSPHVFKIMMCYTDPQATAATNHALINDLDLYLVDDAGDTIRPWVLNPSSPASVAVRGIDTLNNIEQITVNQPTSSYYVYHVQGTSIPSGHQIFSVNWLEQDTSLRMVYPNGGEKWLPPSSSGRRQIIRWDAFGLSGNASLSYSTDAGSTWNLISTTVNLNTGYYIWQNCPASVATSEALIKIEQGTWVDSSDAVFDIFETGPTPFAVPCSEQLHITWNPMANASSYKVYMHDSGQMKLQGITQDTFLTIKGLSDTLSYWVAVSAISNNGAEGPRSIAVEFNTNPSIETPTFQKHPRDTSLCSGSALSFNALTLGTGTISRTWQVSQDHGQSWNAIANSNSDTLSLSALYTQDDSSLYRLTAINSCQSLEISEEALVQVDSILPFSYSDTLINVCIGQDTLFELVQGGNNKNTASWYFLANGASTPQALGVDTSLIWSLSNIQTSQRGAYYAELNNSCGVQNNAITIELQVNDPLQVSIAGDDTICLGQTALNTAIASGGRPSSYEYFWQKDTLFLAGALLSQMQDSAERWTAGVFDYCSQDTVYENKTIQVRSVPQVSLPGDTTICKGTSINIAAHATGGNASTYHYLWSNGLPDAAQVSVSPSVTTTYQLVLTDSCSTPTDTAYITVNVLDELNVEIIAATDTSCYGQEQVLTLQVSGGDSNNYQFTWDDGSASQTRSIRAFADSSFTVQLNDGCTPAAGRDSIRFIVRAPLQVNIIGKDTLCNEESQTLTLSYSGGDASQYDFTWDDGSKSINRTISSTSNQTYRVELKDQCTPNSSQDSFSIVVRPPLQVSISGKDTLCSGEVSTFTAIPSGGQSSTYALDWNGSSSNFITIKGFADTTIEVTLSDGCTPQSASVQKKIVVRAPLELLPLPDLRTCEGNSETIELQPRGGRSSSYAYFVNGEQQNSPRFTRTYTDSTLLVYRLSDNCSEKDAFDTMWVDIRPINPVIFNVVQENLVVKAKTFDDQKIDYWGPSLNELSRFNDSMVSITYPTFGPVQLCLQKEDDAGCTESRCISLNLFDVYKTRDFRLVIYPNPASDQINVELDKVAGNVQINLITTDGRYVWRNQYTTFNQTIYTYDVSSLASSVYILEVMVNDEIIRQQIVVQ